MKQLKFVLTLLFVLCLPLTALATQVRGTLLDANGRPMVGAIIEFELGGCADANGIPTLVSGGVLVQKKYTLKPGPGGQVIGQIVGNDQILCGGGTNTWWIVRAKVNTTVIWTKSAIITGGLWHIDQGPYLEIEPTSVPVEAVLKNSTFDQIIVVAPGRRLEVQGTFIADVTGNVAGNADTATALASDPAACTGNAWLKSFTAAGVTTCTQPSFSNLSGTLSVAQLPGFSGDVTSSAGSTSLTLADSGVSAGTYTKITVDAKGRATVGATASSSDLSDGDLLVKTNAGQTISAGHTFSGTLTFSNTNAFNAQQNLNAGEIVTVGLATNVPSVIRGYTSQSADLSQWQNSSSTVLAKVTAGGVMSAQGYQINGTDLFATSNVFTAQQILTNGATLGTSDGTASSPGLSLYQTMQNAYSGGYNIYKRGNASSLTGAVGIGELGYHGFWGWDGTGYGRGGFIIAYSTEPWTNTAHGTRLSLATTPNGSTTNIERLFIGQDGAVLPTADNTQALGGDGLAWGSVVGYTVNAKTGFQVNGASLNFSHLADTLALAKLANCSVEGQIPKWTSGGGWACGTDMYNATGAQTFTQLTDAPTSYTGQGGKALRVNAGATGIEFYDATGLSAAAQNTWSAVQTYSVSPVLNNNIPLQMKNSGGTGVNVLNFNASNQVVLGGGQILLQPTLGQTLLGLTGTTATVTGTLNATTDYQLNGTSYKDAAQVFTNKTFDAEATGNVLRLPSKIYAQAAGCEGSAPYSLYDTPATNNPIASCVTGTNQQKGTLRYSNAGTQWAQFTLAIPADQTGTYDVRLLSLPNATTNATWTLSYACTAANATDDPAWSAWSAMTVASSGANGLGIGTLSGVTGCTAGQLMHLKVARTDTGGPTQSDLLGIELTIRRSM